MPTDDAGCGWYRIRTPIAAAERQGLIELMHTDHQAWLPTVHADFPGMSEKMMQESAKMRDFYHRAGDWGDVLVTQRYTQIQHGAGFQSISRVMGVPWIVDLDDDVFHIDQFNPAYMTYRNKQDSEIADIIEIDSEDEALPGDMVQRRADGQLRVVRLKQWDYQKIARRCIQLADALVVTNETLADVYRAHRRHLGVEERVFVVPNCLDPVLWSAPTPAPPHPGEVWVGWAGAGSHLADLILLEKVVDEILTRHPEVRFFWTRLPSPHLNRLAKKWGPRCMCLEAWSSIANWSDYYTAMNFDIALAPLEDTKFTRSKSNLKWLEAGILGQAMVASDCGPYQRTIRHGHDGFLANEPYQWVEYISQLVRNPEKRRAIGEAAKRRVLTEFSLEHTAKKWVEVYETVKREYGPAIAERARVIREKGHDDEISDSDRHGPEGDSPSEGRSDARPNCRPAMVGTA